MNKKTKINNKMFVSEAKLPGCRIRSGPFCPALFFPQCTRKLLKTNKLSIRGLNYFWSVIYSVNRRSAWAVWPLCRSAVREASGPGTRWRWTEAAMPRALPIIYVPSVGSPPISLLSDFSGETDGYSFIFYNSITATERTRELQPSSKFRNCDA